MQKSVLVVGDLAVDRNWLISEPAADEQRHASHESVAPRGLIDPKRYTDVAGGIGTIARALAAITSGRVYAAGAWSEEVNSRLDDLLPAEVNQGHGKARTKPDVHFIRLASPKFTLLRHRIYTPEPVGTRLLHRFDRDPPVTSADRLDLNKLPDRDEIGLVVLGDYNGALLNVPEVIEAIHRRYEGLPMVVRSANAEVIGKYPWTILTLNVHWAARVAGRDRLDEPIFRRIAPMRCTWHPTLIRTLRDIADRVRLSAKRAFVLNMEEDGVLVLHRDVIRPRMLAAPDELRSLAVGGNDVLLAWMVHHYLLSSGDGSLGERLAGACEPALRAAYVFTSRSKVLEGIDNYYAPRVAVSEEDLEHAPPLAPFTDDDKLPKTSTLKGARSVGAILGSKAVLPQDREIRLHDANWYLGDFLTIDETFGETLIRLKRHLREYVRSPGPRPFVTGLCGEPGAGKSTLAEKLAQIVGVTPIFENVAQWDSPADLGNVCERVRTAQMRHERPLVFLDEIDTSLHGELLYAKLLSPIWDGSYATHGEVRTLGTPTIFLLAGSGEEWVTRKALRQAAAAGKVAKLADLVSRFTFPVVEVPALHRRKQDIAYLVVYNIKRRFPRVEEVEEGIFRLIAQSTCRYGARSVARVIELLGRPAGRRVHNADLPESAGEYLSMFLAGMPQRWREQKTIVRISP